MQRGKTILAFILFSVLINFVSAQFYGGTSLSNILYSVDNSTIVLGLIFLIAFALTNMALMRTLKGNRAVSSTIAFSISLLIIWSVNRSGINFVNPFYGFFFFLPTGFLETIWPLLLLGLGIFFIVKMGFKKGIGTLLMGVGTLLIFLGATGSNLDSGTSFAVGITLLIVGAGLFFWARGRGQGGRGYADPSS